MRLDWFLPFLRKAKRGVVLRPPGWLGRAARRVLPKSWMSDLVSGRPGFARRLLRNLGDTWLSSPYRRVVQGACFVAFLWLFFYVCWPYSARPAEVSRGWIPVEVDAATGYVTVEAEEPPVAAICRGALVYIAGESLPNGEQYPHAAFHVRGVGLTSLDLEPAEQISAEHLELLAGSVGPWTLHTAPPGGWPAHYAENLRHKERMAAETFLAIDPLVSISTALAARSWVWSLVSAGAILLVCVLIPRGFCGYVCPLGTVIDLFDWALARRIKRFQVPDDGWWVHIKYYLLLGTLVASLFGVLTAGFVAAIPVITRGLLFLLGPLATGFARGWHLVPPMNPGHLVSLGLFAAVLALGFLKPRFWCKYVCPSGAVFSLGNLLRVSERKVESSCIHCNKCIEICPFDAIKPDFTTRTTDCTLCQTCGGVCPTHAIKFVERWNKVSLKVLNDPPTQETPLGRRGFLAASVGAAAGAAGGWGAAAVTLALDADGQAGGRRPAVRPPGSVPEPQFLDMCIRCGECFQACPNNVLQPQGFFQGLEGLWTPRVEADWAGCESSCNACGQVCPTGAIRALPLDEKKVCRMGLAIVDRQTCLPFAGRGACQLCVDECVAAGYHAIEFTRVGTEVDESGQPIEDSGYLAPVVLADKCVGCGLCQTRCYGINVAEERLLAQSAIVVEAGPGNEDRLLSGSYIALREHEARQRAAERRRRLEQQGGSDYLPDFVE